MLSLETAGSVCLYLELAGFLEKSVVVLKVDIISKKASKGSNAPPPLQGYTQKAQKRMQGVEWAVAPGQHLGCEAPCSAGRST